MNLRTHLPEDAYLTRLGRIVYLVSSIEGLLLFDLSRLAGSVPPELLVSRLASMTTRQIGDELTKYAAHCSDDVAPYVKKGGEALTEIAPPRNDVLHARAATD